MAIPLFDKETEGGAMVHEKRMKNEESLFLLKSEHGHRYSTARVSERPTDDSTARLRARYCAGSQGAAHVGKFGAKPL